MPVSFEQIPSDIRTPGVYVEIDPTGAVEGAGVRPHTMLAIGYRLATGTVAENVPKQITSKEQASGYFGQGSQLAAMCGAILNANERTPLIAMGVDEASGTPATGSFNLSGSVGAPGTLAAYVAGKRYLVGAVTGASATALGDDLAAAINADTDAPVTAANVTGTVTCTCKWDGPEGNDIDLRVNYRLSEETPLALTVGVTAMSGGATSPDFTAGLITAMAGDQYDTVICGITDDGNVDELESELETRWGPMVDIDGHLFLGICKNEDLTDDYTGTRNHKQTTIVAPGPSPTPPWIVAANAGAIDAYQTGIDPARPRTTLVLPDVMAPGSGERLDQSARNRLLWKGASTCRIDASGNVMIERLITTYLVNSQGAPDPTWLDLTTKRTVSFLRWDWDARITLKYPRHKLADDGTLFSPGQAIVTPSTIRAEAIAWFEEKMLQGLVENLEQFKQDLIVERNTSDYNRLDAILRPNVINKLVAQATKLQFRL